MYLAPLTCALLSLHVDLVGAVSTMIKQSRRRVLIRDGRYEGAATATSASLGGVEATVTSSDDPERPELISRTTV